MADAAQLNQRLRRKNREIAKLREELDRARGDEFDPSRIIWIFGSGRTGSTWMGRMLGELPGSAVWREPVVGALFGEFYFDRFPHRRGREFLFADKFKPVWLRGIRSIVLDGAGARFGSLAGHLAINEPHGTVGARLLSEALPESRVLFLVRDPRDVIASVYDAQRAGGFAAENIGRKPSETAETQPSFFSGTAKTYLWNLEHASDAFRHHRGPKSLVRYEDLRRDTVAELSRVCAELGLGADATAVAAAVAAHDWDSLEEEKGPGSFYRKASPGSWAEDLSPEQVAAVEEAAAPVLAAFYDGDFDLELLEPGEHVRVAAPRVLWDRVLHAEGRVDD